MGSTTIALPIFPVLTEYVALPSFRQPSPLRQRLSIDTISLYPEALFYLADWFSSHPIESLKLFHMEVALSFPYMFSEPFVAGWNAVDEALTCPPFESLSRAEIVPTLGAALGLSSIRELIEPALPKLTQKILWLGVYRVDGGNTRPKCKSLGLIDFCSLTLVIYLCCTFR